MADAVHVPEAPVPNFEVHRHERIWRNFVRFLTVSGVGTAILLGVMAIFLL